MIHDLYGSMITLIQDVMGNYLPVQAIKKSGIQPIQHMDRSIQLSDTDIFITNDARVLLTAMEDDELQGKLDQFFE